MAASVSDSNNTPSVMCGHLAACGPRVCPEGRVGAAISVSDCTPRRRAMRATRRTVHFVNMGWSDLIDQTVGSIRRRALLARRRSRSFAGCFG